ncbi:hypothetical protein BDV97DRAFT_278101, partial [Delphinella strobiligena]
YLEKWAESFLVTSPALSAYLGAQRDRLCQVQHVLPEDHETRKACQSCGSILVPGWSCKKYRPRPNPQQKKDAKKHSASPVKASIKKAEPLDYVAYECDLCHVVTRFKLPTKKTKVATRKMREPDGTTNVKVTGASSLATTPSKDVEGSGRKRAKKNKSGGLAALLAKSKNESASPAGFDLMDF